MIKREGVYSYQCGECETLFAVVSRLSVSRDKQSTLICPRCSTSSQLTGEGYIAYHLYDKEKREEEKTGTEGYPVLLTVKEVMDILSVSKQVAYEVMNRKDFPILCINRLKRVKRDAFFKWLDDQSKNSNP